MPEQPDTDNPFQLPAPLDKHPVLKKIQLGAPPFFRVAPGEYYKSLEPIEEGVPDLLTHGLEIYGAKNGDYVLTNPAFAGEDELRAVDESGKLPEVVPTYAQVSGETPTKMDEAAAKRRLATQEKVKRKMAELQTRSPKGDRPAIMADLAKAPVAKLGAPAPVPAMAAPSGGGSNGSLQKSRAKNLQPGSPSSGAVPGGGRVLNGLLKQAY